MSAQTDSLRHDSILFRQYLSGDTPGRVIPASLWLNLYRRLAHTGVINEMKTEYYASKAEPEDFTTFRVGNQGFASGFDPAMYLLTSSGGGQYFSADTPRFPEQAYEQILNSCRNYVKSHPDVKAEKARLTASLTAFDSLAYNRPLFFRDIETSFGGDISAYVDDLYKHSIITNKRRRSIFLRWPRAEKIENDPGVRFTIALALYELWMRQEGGEAH